MLAPFHVSFLCRPRMPLISSLLLVGLSQTAYAHIPPVINHFAFGVTLTDRKAAAELRLGGGVGDGGLTLVLLGKKEKK